MLVQVVALLGLVVLGSSAPLQEECSRTMVGLIIQELLQDIKKLNLNAVTSFEIVNAKLERCMHSHLKTFAGTLKTHDIRNMLVAMDKLNTCNNILPKDLDKECKTTKVTKDDFLDTLDTFLRLLYEIV